MRYGKLYDFTRRMLLLGIFAVTIIPTWSRPISEKEALQRAQRFLTERGKSQDIQQRLQLAVKGRKAPATNQQDAQKCACYVYNISQNGGFVIVSGDDRTACILGYADCGSISEDNMPDGLRYLLDGYAEQMEWLETHDTNIPHETNSVHRVARSPISPLIETRWNQGAPYNKFCPEINDANQPHAATGCVATSMAQVMYYHKYPQNNCTAIPGYTTRNKSFNLASLDATSFAWSAMTHTYASNATGEAADEVAKLMQYCGYALQMNYGKSSGAFNCSIADVLKAYFGYDNGVNFILRKFYSYYDWINLIYAELADYRPVVLGGQSAGGGHSFVCDGYEVDDYFHINWGWGGSSDGYFRLSLLDPYEQGIGGSSTLDGFSYSQEAVIGIKPGDGSTPLQSLSLEAFQFTEKNDDSVTVVIDRDNESGDYIDIPIFATLFNYMPTNTFDIVFQLENEDGTLVANLLTIQQEIAYAHGIKFDDYSLTVPANISDGTYYISIVSRPTNESYWQPCYNMNYMRIKAVIADNTLTLTAPCAVLGSGATPSCLSITTSDNPTVGYEVEVTAEIKGNSLDYHDALFLYVNGNKVMGRQADVPAGETVNVRFAYTPKMAGNNKLAIYAGSNKILKEEDITVTGSDASNTQDITVNPTITNLTNEGKLYGNAMRVTATVSNPSEDNSFVSKLNCSLRKYDSAEAEENEYVDATVINKTIVIEPNSSIEVPFEYDRLEMGKFYRLRFTYTQGYTEDGKPKTRTKQALITDPYEMGEGYAVYNADGTTSIYSLSAELNAGSAACVDLTGISSFSGITINPSSNPNCIYLLASGATTPNALTGKNVVSGSATDNLALTDGYDFYSPVAFTATNVSYTRTFTLAANGNSGWSTIMLPFTVNTVKVDDGSAQGKTVDWFHKASDTGKNFWVRGFTGDGESSLTFDYANAMTANTPYIIAVPDDRWGSDWQMTGKAVTFIGNNATIATTTDGSINGYHYNFCGSTILKDLENVYVLNEDATENPGSKFVKKTSISIAPFRAWFGAVHISSLDLPALTIGSPDTNGVGEIMSLEPEDNATWYTLSGTRLNSKPTVKGIYIYQGKKIIIQ